MNWRTRWTSWLGVGLLMAGCSGAAGGWRDLEVTIDPDQFVDSEGTPQVEGDLQTSTLEVARAGLPFQFNLPTVVPEGYALLPEVEWLRSTAPGGYAMVLVTWENVAEETTLTLQVAQGAQVAINSGSGEATQVHGQPAEFERTGGGLRAERLMLRWAQGAVVYTLAADVLDEAALLQVAESVAGQ